MDAPRSNFISYPQWSNSTCPDAFFNRQITIVFWISKESELDIESWVQDKSI